MGCRWKGAAFLAAGHHATGKYDVQALGEHLAVPFGLQHSFIDIPNPVRRRSLAEMDSEPFYSFISCG